MVTSARLLTSWASTSPFLVEELAQCGQQAVELLHRVGDLVVGVGEAVGELRQVVVQRHELLIVFGAGR